MYLYAHVYIYMYISLMNILLTQPKHAPIPKLQNPLKPQARPLRPPKPQFRTASGGPVLNGLPRPNS